MWDEAPALLTAHKTQGGRHGTLFSDITLEYANDRPGRVRLIVFPFDGYPEGLKTPRAIAENILRTGRLGTGVFDPVATATSNGLGPEAMAAAAWLFRKYHLPEAHEAEEFALSCMKSFTDLDSAGTHTQQLYYLLNGCRLLAELGHPEYLVWTRRWADRILEMQQADGSFPWLNFQLRCMAALLRAQEMTGDPKYRSAFDRALATVEYRSDGLYWKGAQQQDDDFAGALPFAIFGHLGERDLAQKALDSRIHFIDDRGFQACSDLNPYMLGFSAAGLKLTAHPDMVLGLSEFVDYDGRTVRRVSSPTAYVVNPYHPMSKEIDFALPP
jgi:hypothetical protein